MKHLFILAVLLALGYLAYKLYESGEFGQKPPSQTAVSASQQPADAGQQAAQSGAAGAPAKPDEAKQPKPADVIGGILSSGKKVGKGASKAFKRLRAAPGLQ
jgi:predicted lipid-binding transport protein (Tim44 family)